MVRASDCALQRWKNDLGSTREIVVQPSTEAGVDFLWRASIAEVDRAVPFSTFPGIDRHIVLLDGACFDMLLDRTHRHALITPFESFAFSGEASVTITLRAGTTRDFNLMVQRSFGVGEILCVFSKDSFTIDAASVLVFAARGCLHVDANRLETGDSWCRHLADADPMGVTIDEGAVALIVNIHYRA